MNMQVDIAGPVVIFIVAITVFLCVLINRQEQESTTSRNLEYLLKKPDPRSRSALSGSSPYGDSYHPALRYCDEVNPNPVKDVKDKNF
ncbi:MAG: hypothetical protein BAJATHORv1_60020 [Candidatus Thorarchaeota archaeon]|nr:MAG: hypothetical protein BAJATHORv1_60020 [Candidatus Thorarchaeota archaeon]